MKSNNAEEQSSKESTYKWVNNNFGKSTTTTKLTKILLDKQKYKQVKKAMQEKQLARETRKEEKRKGYKQQDVVDQEVVSKVLKILYPEDNTGEVMVLDGVLTFAIQIRNQVKFSNTRKEDLDEDDLEENIKNVALEGNI